MEIKKGAKFNPCVYGSKAMALRSEISTFPSFNTFSQMLKKQKYFKNNAIDF